MAALDHLAGSGVLVECGTTAHRGRGARRSLREPGTAGPGRHVALNPQLSIHNPVKHWVFRERPAGRRSAAIARNLTR
jgi:hypothetical protein